ncbi:MAG TPA: hypothetical protein VK157_01490 [Phycisphaerales bacterium]|nr:hypothetical protein [Phycisphaerales bacterium]
MAASSPAPAARTSAMAASIAVQAAFLAAMAAVPAAPAANIPATAGAIRGRGFKSRGEVVEEAIAERPAFGTRTAGHTNRDSTFVLAQV